MDLRVLYGAADSDEQKADGAAYEKLRRCSDRRIQSAGVS